MKMPDPVTNWIDARIRAAVDEALSQLHDEIQTEMQTVETNLTAQITSVPGLVASQIGHVVVDAEAIANNVATDVRSFLNPADLVQQIIGGVLQGIPNIFNPFKGGLHDA